MERSEAETIYAAGREPVVEALVALSARLEAQDAQLAALSERVEELEQRLKRDSRNSSLPPSHDPPSHAPRLARLFAGLDLLSVHPDRRDLLPIGIALRQSHSARV